MNETPLQHPVLKELFTFRKVILDTLFSIGSAKVRVELILPNLFKTIFFLLQIIRILTPKY